MGDECLKVYRQLELELDLRLLFSFELEPHYKANLWESNLQLRKRLEDKYNLELPRTKVASRLDCK